MNWIAQSPSKKDSLVIKIEIVNIHESNGQRNTQPKMYILHCLWSTETDTDTDTRHDTDMPTPIIISDNHTIQCNHWKV